MEKPVNPVLVLVRNNLKATLRCLDSIITQTIPVKVMIIDNDSDEATCAGIRDYVRRRDLEVWRFSPQLGVSAGWNFGLRAMFNEANHVLVLNNDVVLPPWFYESLLELRLPFVTGTETDNIAGIVKDKPRTCTLLPFPDFSAYLIQRVAWELVGSFDERMVHYASDCDYHVRAYRAGVSMYQVPEIQFYHERSSTIRHSTPEEAQAIETRANLDRAVFREKYGCIPGQPEYAELFQESSCM